MKARIFARLALAAVVLAGVIVGCNPCPCPETNSEHKLGTAGVSQWSYAAGTAGTVTLTAGQQVTAIRAHATSAGTLTITPSNSSILDATAGASIPIPANTYLALDPTDLAASFGGGPALRDNTVLVFGSTDQYLVILYIP